jgi:Beta-propeller repeat
MRLSAIIAFLIAGVSCCNSSVATPGLSYATYFGGSGEENLSSMTRDFSGNIYVGGSTDSRDLSALADGAFPSTLHGEQALCFVSRFSPDGTKIDFSEVLPAPRPTLEPLIGAPLLDRGAALANGECRITSVATDLWGTLYVAGITTLVDPGDANHPAAVPFGNALGFVQKFKPRPPGDPAGLGLTLQWSKLFGDIPAPSGDPSHPKTSVTAINSLTTTSSGNIVIAGNTTSMFYPVTAGPVTHGDAYQNAMSGRQSGVITVLDYTGAVVSSTYLGVQDSDDHQSTVSLSSVAINSVGNILVGGSFNHIDRLWFEWTEAFLTPSKYPITPNAFEPIEVSEALTLNGFVGITDAIMTEFDPELSSLAYSVVDSAGADCAAPGIPNVYHTMGEKVAVDSNDNRYLLMSTNSSCLYTTDQAEQKQLSGFRDAAILKVASSGYAKGTTTPAFAYQSYLGFGPKSVTNRCGLAVAPGIGADAPDNVYVACSVVGGRRNSLIHFAATTIPREDISTEDSQPFFPGENIFVVRSESSDTASNLAYTFGFGGTYANGVSDIVLNDLNTRLYFTGTTLSADFPVTTDAFDRNGSTQSDGVLGAVDTTP